MKLKTSDLKGPALDYAVAVCEGHKTEYIALLGLGLRCFPYSQEWSLAGPIIEREKLHINHNRKHWMASTLNIIQFGDTYLQAAMRCYVASKMGDEVEAPEELL